MNLLSRKGLRHVRFAFVVGLLAGGLASTSAGAGETRSTSGTATSADGVRIAYEALGEGKTAVVFVHGWSCDRSYWREQLRSFAEQYRVVAVDLAGHGESGAGRKAWTMAAFGADVAAVVEKLGLERVILVGHSMGGDVVVEAARELPGRVAGLVWIDTYKQLGTPRTPQQLQATLQPFRADFVETTRSFVRGMFPPTTEPSLVTHVANDMSAAPPAVALGALESALAFAREMPGALKELQLPVVAINPAQPPTDVASLKRHGVDVVVMPDVGHFPMLEAPERFDVVLAKVLDRLARRARP